MHSIKEEWITIKTEIKLALAAKIVQDARDEFEGHELADHHFRSLNWAENLIEDAYRSGTRRSVLLTRYTDLNDRLPEGLARVFGRLPFIGRIYRATNKLAGNYFS